MTTLDELRARVEMLPESDGRTTALGMLDDVPAVKSGTMRAWCQAHHGRKVDTLQCGYGGRLWLPLARTVNARASMVEFDGSRREYAGMRVLASDARTLAVANDDGVLAIYRVTEGR